MIPTLPTPEQQLAFGESLLSPVLFAENLLQVKLFDQQREILEAVHTHRQISIKACNSSGKTRCLGILALYWVARYENAVVIITSASALQVEKGIFGEIHGLAATGHYPVPPGNLSEIKFTPRRYIVGFSTTTSERDGAARLAGLRSTSGDTLVLVDEATGLKNEHFTAIQGILAGGNNTRLVISGNPTVGASGSFYYDSFHKNRAQFKTVTISAYDTPNLRGLTPETLIELPDHELDQNEMPFLVTRRWVRDRLLEWTEESPQYAARVLGEFPEQAENALISLVWLERARAKAEGDSDAPIRGGLDCSTGGPTSETVLVLQQAGRIILIKGWSLPDPVPQIIAELRPYMERGLLASLAVDSIGVGFGFVKPLTEAGFPVVGINVGLPASDPERFQNAKAEYYQGLADAFKAGYVSGLDDEKTIGQLSAIRYRLTPKGQIQIEGKDEARSRAGHRTKFDRAEACMLAFSDSGTGGAIFSRSFSDDLIYDAAAPPEILRPGKSRMRYISIGYGASLPMTFQEIYVFDSPLMVVVTREYYWDNLRALSPKADAQFVDDLQKFLNGEDPISGERSPVDPRGTTVIVRRDEDTENFIGELLRRGIYYREAQTDVLPSIQLVGNLFTKKAVRVSSACGHLISETLRYRWDKQKALQGIEEPQSSNKQAVEAFRHLVYTIVNPWQFM